MSDAYPRGRFCWFELMSTDPAKAREFYTQAMGWGLEEFEGDMDYTMFTNNAQALAGTMQLAEEAQAGGAPSHWLGYVAVPSVDETVEQAIGLGATVMVPATDIPEIGRFSIFADPQGAVIAAYTAIGDVAGHDGPPEVGEFSWHELYTTDYESAFSFYERLFGWEKMEAMDMGPAGIYQIYGRGGLPLGGMMNKTEEMPGPPGWLYYVRVPDATEATKTIEALGGTLLNGPIEVPGGDMIAHFMDPAGAAFAVHSVKTD